MTPVLIALLVLAPGKATKSEAAKKKDKEKVTSAPRATKTAASLPVSDETECSACHQPSNWRRVTFDHDATGFALNGRHVGLACEACHTRGIEQPVETSCQGCHQDPHAGTLGTRCQGCHDEQSFRATFTADAHRKALFPLTGKHALIPCEQCHGPQRERVFTRVAMRCIDCHQNDYDETGTRSIDHASAGFSLECRQCHGTWRFTPAAFADHDACFQLGGSPHAILACRDCHTTLAGAAPGGTCNTLSAACSACHTHDCARTDAQHANVAGYQCKDRKCYECHRFSR